MSWLSKEPAAMPPAPADVDVMKLMGEAADAPSSAALGFFRSACPPQRFDKWGQPIEMSVVDHGRAARLFAILVSPLARGMALLKAGAILPEEVDAIAQVFPDLYLHMSDELTRAMLAAKPPLRPWAEAVIATWYRMPSAEAFAAASGDKPTTQKTGGGGQADFALPTPADRREIAVREQR